MTISIDPIAEAATIRPVQPLEVGRLSRALTQAFYADDPVFDWFFPQRRGRFDRMVRFFRGIALERMTLPHGHVYTHDAIAGGALWVPPGAGDQTVGEQLRMVPEILRVAGRDLVRHVRGQIAFEEGHPREEHWYLLFVGVAPEWRGAGLGTALMRPVLDRADEEGMPVYLDATSPVNRRMYERHGFEVTGEFRLPAGPPLWRMWREPS